MSDIEGKATSETVSSAREEVAPPASFQNPERTLYPSSGAWS